MNTYVTLKPYIFKDCVYTDGRGRKVEIPDGSWDVAELDMVAISLSDGKIHDLPSSTFQLLKNQGKAVLVEH